MSEKKEAAPVEAAEVNPKTENSSSAGKTKEYFEEQGEKSKENRSKGGEDVKASLTNKTMVRFTKDHGFFKKGHEQEVSDVALAIYEKAKAVEKI